MNDQDPLPDQGHLRLVLRPAHGAPQELILRSGRLSIGRSRDNSLQLDDASLSRHHALVERRPAGWFVVDLDSRNGVELNGLSVRGEAPLHRGDRIRVGGAEIDVHDRPSQSVTLTPRRARTPRADIDARGVASGATPLAGGAEATGTPAALHLLARCSAELLTHRPLEEGLVAALDLIRAGFSADRAAVALLPPGGRLEPELTLARGPDGPLALTISRTLAARVVEQARAVLVTDLDSDEHLSTAESLRIAGVHSLMCVPLLAGAEACGLLHVDRLAARGDYTEADLHLLTVLASTIALKVENARLQQQSAERRQVEEELRTAGRIQRRLLPLADDLPPGVDLFGACRTCSEVGGDFYDWFVLEDGCVAVVVADVCGKGMSGALLAAGLQAAVRGGAAVAASPAERLRWMNAFVRAHGPAERFVTVAHCVLDPRTGRLAYSSAGHPPPILQRADGTTVLLDEGGVPLGLFEDAVHAEGQTVLGPGDRLILYTDGVTEAAARGQREPQFGTDRIAESAGDLSSSSRDACLRIFAAVDEFTASAPLTDDATVLALRLTDPEPPLLIDDPSDRTTAEAPVRDPSR